MEVGRRVRWVVLVAMWVALGACSPGGRDQAEADGLNVAVSILPQRYFVERIGGERVDVSVMVLPGENPATYEPKPEQLAQLRQTDAYISIGVPFEDVWLDRIRSANPEMRVVDGAQGIERLPLEDHHHDGSTGGAEEEIHLDPHVWTSPRLAKAQAQTIARTLIEMDGAYQATYDANLAAFLADIDSLDQELTATLRPATGKSFLTFHPSWGYLAHDYGLVQIAIEVGGQEPSAREMATLISEAEDADIRVVFTQPEFSTRAAQTIADEIGGEVVLVSPLDPDWLGNMRRVSQAFARALE